MTNLPLVSVLMTTLNSEQFISEAIDSVLAQSLSNFELLVIDGGSADRTVEAVLSMTDPRICLYQFPGLHRGARLNHGVTLSKAGIIAIMDSDDIAMPTRLQRQFEMLSCDKAISIVGTWAILVDESGEHIGMLRRPVGHHTIVNQLFAMNGLCWPSSCWKKDLIDRGTHFNDVIRRFEDIDWYAQIEPFARFANIPEPLMMLRQTSNSLGRVSSERDRSLLFNAVHATFRNQLTPNQPIKRRSDILRNIGMCSYYYGKKKTTVRYLLRSFVAFPFSLLTLRYLIVEALIPAELLARLRAATVFRRLSASLRVVSTMMSVVVSKVRK